VRGDEGLELPYGGGSLTSVVNVEYVNGSEGEGDGGAGDLR